MINSVWYREKTDIIGIIEGYLFTAKNGAIEIQCEITDHAFMSQFLIDNGYVYIGEL